MLVDFHGWPAPFRMDTKKGRRQRRREREKRRERKLLGVCKINEKIFNKDTLYTHKIITKSKKNVSTIHFSYLNYVQENESIYQNETFLEIYYRAKQNRKAIDCVIKILIGQKVS